jgi:hypothetical protein
VNRDEPVEIAGRECWFKVVGMLQQNWALIDSGRPDVAWVWFLTGKAGVFGELAFPSQGAAEQALRRNGFRRFDGDPEARDLIAPPDPPFVRRAHPNGPIYSSGRFWM